MKKVVVHPSKTMTSREVYYILRAMNREVYWIGRLLRSRKVRDTPYFVFFKDAELVYGFYDEEAGYRLFSEDDFDRVDFDFDDFMLLRSYLIIRKKFLIKETKSIVKALQYCIEFPDENKRAFEEVGVIVRKVLADSKEFEKEKRKKKLGEVEDPRAGFDYCLKYLHLRGKKVG